MAVSRLDKAIKIFNLLGFVALLISLAAIFLYAPVERSMGNVQRIFYFHVGTAWVGAAAFFVSLAAGVAYLRKPNRNLDILSLASVEVGLLFLTVTIAAGSIWGKPAWNTYWEWSPRLILITIAWLMYVAYFMLRGSIEDEERRGRFAAVYVIAAFISIILAYGSIRIWRDIHPVLFGGTLESAQGASEGIQDIEPGLASMKMGITLTINTISFSIIYVAWLLNRIRLEKLNSQVNALKTRVALRLQKG